MQDLGLRILVIMLLVNVWGTGCQNAVPSGSGGPDNPIAVHQAFQDAIHDADCLLLPALKAVEDSRTDKARYYLQVHLFLNAYFLPSLMRQFDLTDEDKTAAVNFGRQTLDFLETYKGTYPTNYPMTKHCFSGLRLILRERSDLDRLERLRVEQGIPSEKHLIEEMSAPTTGRTVSPKAAASGVQ